MFSFFLHFLLYFAWVRSSNYDLFHLAKRDITPNIESHPQGCSPVDTSGIKPGLKMDLYRFPITPPGTGCWSWDWLTVTPDFPRSGYWKWPKIAEVDGVVGPLHLDSGHPTCDPLTSVLPHGFNYLQSITTTNFTMVLHGYFVPKQSGKYTFEFKADDALLLNLGAGNAFSCCDYNNSQYNQGEYLAYAIWSKNNQTATLYLEKGIYYPIRVFYHNRCCGAYMDVVYYFNDSPIPNRDFSGLLFSIPDSDSCDANIGFDETCSSINTITTYSTQYITTSPPSGNTPITSTIYYIATPCNNTPEKPRCPTGFYDPFNNVCYIPDYTTTFTSDGHTITEVVSHITTTDSNRKTVTYTTTMMSYAENGPGLYTSFGPAPPVETHTVVLENNMTNYEVVSYWTTTNEFGGLITTSSTSTYSAPPLTVTATTASDYIESDWISFFITTNDKGDIITDSTLFNATRDYNLPEAPHTSFGPAPPVETHTVVLENNMTNYEVVSYWTTTNEFGGLITTSSTSTYSAPPLTVTATTASDYIESDWISFFITTNDKGDIITDSTLFNATRDYNLPEAPHTSFGPAPPVETHTVVLENNMTNYEVVSYWTTTNEFGGLITTSSTSTYSAPPLTVTATTASDYIESDWISFFITTNDKGDIITDSTLFNATRDYNLPEAPHTSFGPAPPVETHTVVLENNMTNYEVVSYWTTTNEFGGLITTSSTSTYSAPPLTVTATTASDYIESDWISFFITTNDKGDIITDSTLFNATRDYNLPEAPHTSFGPAPPVETHTVVLENNMTNYEVVSYWTTTNEFGGLITTSSTSTYSAPPLTVTATTASDYIESDWISFFITTNDKGDIITDSTLFNATRDYNLPEAPHTSFGPAPPVETHTVVLENNMTNYEVVSYWTTTNEFGGLITTSSTSTYSAPPLTVTATTASDYIESDWISFFITTNDKGDIITDSTLFNATRDYIDAQAPFTSSSSYLKSEVEESDYTTTIDKGNGDFETDLVSHITTKDSDGKPTTITTTIPLKPSDAGEADYTTTITSDGHTITEVVSHITTTDSDGNTVTYTTTMASFDQVGDGVYTSAPPYSQPPVVTTTVTEDDGSSKTVVISYSPSEGEDGVTRTGTTTISTITASGEADYTTTIDKGNGDFETDLVSHIMTKDSDGKPTTIITTVTLTEEPDYTSVFVSDGHTITAVVSHVTTTNDIGQTVTTTVTVMSYDQVGEGVFTSAPAYSQPPVTTTTVSANTATATVVISYFPSIGDNGVTRTGTTTISTVPVGGEVDYTTTVDRGNGSTETDVISHITTTDSNGNPTTITTTITNAPPPSNSKANIGSDYTSTVVSNGHTIVSTVTQTVGGQSHGNTVSSTAPVTTVSGASFNAPGTAGVGGIVNSQKSQSQYVAGQGSGNEKPTQAAGTAGGSGSGSVHQSAGNIVPSGSLSVQSAKGTASPVSGIHSSQTPHSVPSQAQQQGQAQAQAPSSRQQAATTVLLPSGSSVNNIGSGFNSTQTASVLQGKGASIKVTSISILFSIITVIVVGMI
ncbi:EPA21 [Nakaseomyces glabratus]|nr:EPA21 [Nakaseomyces glabratus]UCS24911.1 EPA21 [Nakaseomyces glabratus]UCS30141.1 EPA21 [Nakaseomyces glabratus]UCS35369.1 EPA21 [Nakaseomyces glabratus]